MTEPHTPLEPPLETLIDQCLLADRHRFRKRLSTVNRPNADAALRIRLEGDIQASQALASRRREAIPVIAYPEELPISERRAEIAALIARNQVIVLCGETGSGKSTQLPKICLELDRGVFGRIGHTQPRRIAARSLAMRVSEELGREFGGVVGYKVRFHDHVRPETSIKLLTDGMLLAESQQDRFLNEYDTLIIDEAHERSLNIDFLLGFLRQLLPKRPDLKLIITSATIDPERFSRHFGTAPIINVSGRTYPVEVRYRPPVAMEEQSPDGARLQTAAQAQRDPRRVESGASRGSQPAAQSRAETFNERDDEMQQAILDAVDELSRIDRGDILIFLSGEREIRETAETLGKHRLPATEVLPLYARLSSNEQGRIFHPGGARRIILATNVAETSLTVPGIRYVIDTGFARISRYSHRSKVQRLPVERISRASADQRKGRCGRVAAGVCIRLYAEEDFLSRDEFTEPEILRTNLASVILQMEVLRVGRVDAFPFVDPPDPRLIKDGYRILEEIGAVTTDRRVTTLGQRLARLPVDPRIGRMLLEAAHTGCLGEVLPIAAALSIQDPRERPIEKQQHADEAHRAWRVEGSDFLGMLKLWEGVEERRRHLSKRKFRDWCVDRFLSPNRVQEWHDIHQQLRLQMHEMGYVEGNAGRAGFSPPVPAPGPVETGPAFEERLKHQAPLIHKALLSGLLSQIGFKSTERDYQGARNARFHIFPGSGLFERPPKWVMAAELVETTKLYARTCAAIDPDWVESLAGHLVQRSYSEPHWEKGRGQVAAYERVTLFGLVLVARRKVNYGPINPEESREIFLRFALVEQEFESRAPFWRHNLELIDYVHSLEEKTRRRDILVDEEAIYAFYASRIPEGIFSTPQFERWLRQATRQDPKLLHMRQADLMRKPEADPASLFPDQLETGGLRLPLEYHFDPAAATDGVTLRIPRAVLNQVSPEQCQWLVPGLLRERVIALLRGLPKALRKGLVPIPDTADACIQGLKPSERPLVRELGERIKALTGTHIPEDAWDESAVPDYLRMNFQLLDDSGRIADAGRDLAELKRKHGAEGPARFHRLPARGLERDDLRQWDFGPLPEDVEVDAGGRGGVHLRGFPALIDQGDRVAIRILDSRQNADAAHHAGLRRLIQLSLSQEMRYLRRNLPGLVQMRLEYAKAAAAPEGLVARQEPAPKVVSPSRGTIAGAATQADLEEELIALIVDLTFLEGRPDLRDPEAFQQRLAEGKPRLVTQAQEALALTRAILELYLQVRRTLAQSQKPNWLPSVRDCQAQLDRLVFKGFLQHTPYAQLRHYPRYLKASLARLEKLHHAALRDQQLMQEMAPLYQQWQAWDERCRKDRRHDERIEEFRWAFEELRISLFAQELKTAYPVSVKRLEKRWRELGL